MVVIGIGTEIQRSCKNSKSNNGGDNDKNNCKCEQSVQLFDRASKKDSPRAK